MAAEREVKIRFTGESAVLKGSAGEVRKVFQMMQSDLNDARGAGEKLAAAYEQVADSMTRDMKAISETADVVRDSLGPEMTQAIERTGRTVEDQVQEWRKLGLTLDDITRDSDQLASGLRQLDDSARQSTGNVGDGLEKVAAGSDRARGAMGGFVGGALTELPGLEGAFGPLTQGIDEMTSALVEGDLKFKQLAVTGGAMAGLALAMKAVSDRAAEVAKINAFAEDNIAGYADSLTDAETRLEGIEDHLREIGRLQAVIGDESPDFWTGGMSAVVDFTGALQALGLNLETTAALLEGGQTQIDAWAAAQVAAGADAALVTGAVYALEQQLGAVEEAERRAAVTKAFLGEATADVTRETDRGTDSLGQHMDATARDALAQEALTRALEDAESAQRDLTSAQLAGIDSTYAAADAEDRFIQSLEALAVATDDPTTGVNELDQAQRSAEQAALAMAEANRTNAEAMAEAAGAPLSAAQSNYLLIESLYATALSLDENSPVRAALLGHVATLQGIDPTVSTAVVVDVEDAHSRIGGLQDAVDDLDGTETNTESNADTDTALDRVERLTLAVEGVPGKIAIDVGLTGYPTTMSQLSQLGSRLDEVKRKADAADRAVGRVAG